MPSFDSDDFLTDINHVIGRLKSAGLSRVIVVDLTRPEIGIPVVRVIVPGLEMYAMDQDRMGRRCHEARSRRLSRSQL